MNNDLVPLGRRWLSLLAVRVTCAAVAVAALEVLPGLAGPDDQVVVATAAIYGAGVVALEGLRRVARARWLGLLRLLVLADAVFLALVVNTTGGTSSPLAFLVYLHIVAVTLVVSYRRGLEAAVGHAGLVFLASGALGARYLDGLLASAPSGATLRATSYLLVAVAVAALASVDERALRRSRIHVQAQLDLAAELHAAVHLQPTTTVLARHLVNRLGYRRAVVLGRGPTDDSVGAMVGPEGVVFVDHRAGPITDLTTGRPSTALVARLDDGILDRLLPRAENVVLMTLEADGRPVGVLAAEWGSRRRARIAADLIDATKQSAATAALAQHAATLLASSQRHAGHDDLTGLANRRSLRETVDREVARADRSNGVLSLAVLDLDHFKSVNDRDGHQAGDAVLRTTAATLEREARHGDLCARLGGDEFALLLPDCGLDDAHEVVARIVAAIARDLAPAGVTASAGVASFPTHRSVSELVAAADRALYTSKQQGRGRTSVDADHELDLREPVRLTPA